VYSVSPCRQTEPPRTVRSTGVDFLVDNLKNSHGSRGFRLPCCYDVFSVYTAVSVNGQALCRYIHDNFYWRWRCRYAYNLTYDKITRSKVGVQSANVSHAYSKGCCNGAQCISAAYYVEISCGTFGRLLKALCNAYPLPNLKIVGVNIGICRKECLYRCTKPHRNRKNGVSLIYVVGQCPQRTGHRLLCGRYDTYTSAYGEIVCLKGRVKAEYVFRRGVKLCRYCKEGVALLNHIKFTASHQSTYTSAPTGIRLNTLSISLSDRIISLSEILALRLEIPIFGTSVLRRFFPPKDVSSCF